ncbi:sigma-70 family RNA polymerase sigma factor [Ruminococcus sp.]|uniref:sigma-70 family RNA polymerase sigma factor n=1 Tax=Ruminococcus sp. TaxID=41978 RepID=UPI0025EC7954|nr:sigma-70 family RNA polymerase sigma factor [Ruminococcus sp.]MCI5816879.1 sigma-70 family RNA polymerase sigma factor [Ruminococcus sp.]MDD7555616.1 sigma-70 family RNA polymerase sigma factor [Ruminococcus sp.]MDY4963332.1 sigma-70 family RNA polymerase sigma factor [Ruminococcus callidus]
MKLEREQDPRRQLAGKTDEELAVAAAGCSDSTTELISRYMKLIWVKANSMANAAVDAEDLAQEGMLGLMNAVAHFDPNREIRFSTFADVCITNKMKSALIRSRHTALPVEDAESAAQVQNEVEDDDPEQILLRKERLQELYREMDHILSRRELEIFKLFLSGLRYEQMAERLHITEKSVDNAMQRVRRKLKSVWMTDEFRNADS